MKKNFVVDTNVLLHDPRAIFRFEDNTVIIPIYVIEEIDTFKRDMSELGRNAREISRILDEYRGRGNLGQGVALDGGGTLRVSFDRVKEPVEFLDTHKKDNLILSVALEVQRREPEVPCIFVSKDVNLRVRADVLGLAAEKYEEQDVVSVQELYPGSSELEVDNDWIDQLHERGELLTTLEELAAHRVEGARGRGTHFYTNEYLLLRNARGPQTTLGKIQVDAESGQVTIRPLARARDHVWGIRPRNREQAFALDALLDDSVNVVTLIGKAGTGKTLLAIAAGLQKVTEERSHHKLLVSRPVIPMGRDLGYLPGTVEEKLDPWMRPIFDNVEYLMGISHTDRRSGRGADELKSMGIIEIEPLTYIRGRSLPNLYMIVDEAQNLTPHEVKTILTRVGEGTKIVLTGDPYQIDNPYVDSESNGLSYLVNRFKGQSLASTVTLFKGERSDLAEMAANLL
ncbi:phosphate starvation-inducible protein PhoH [Lujinxingia litoralis]|uniref:Phosphate starvation-inducible protein PhoH n=1 Tax=Lujinxingia litoralis TaxID=2211119 RepID=A0A328C2N9_9DELT|nr:PhoH family protein [Lujinxingia litoralis]RAL20977.1 phosphate starvation-inducible protein PhoH [Lujinxingia litoralis]